MPDTSAIRSTRVLAHGRTPEHMEYDLDVPGLNVELTLILRGSEIPAVHKGQITDILYGTAQAIRNLAGGPKTLAISPLICDATVLKAHQLTIGFRRNVAAPTYNVTGEKLGEDEIRCVLRTGRIAEDDRDALVSLLLNAAVACRMAAEPVAQEQEQQPATAGKLTLTM